MMVVKQLVAGHKRHGEALTFSAPKRSSWDRLSHGHNSALENQPRVEKCLGIQELFKVLFFKWKFEELFRHM